MLRMDRKYGKDWWPGKDVETGRGLFKGTIRHHLQSVPEIYETCHICKSNKVRAGYIMNTLCDSEICSPVSNTETSRLRSTDASTVWRPWFVTRTKLRGLSPQANYTDRASVTRHFRRKLPDIPKFRKGYTWCILGVLTAVVMKSSTFWDIKPCSPLKVTARFSR
jgi:hypothetical protein